MAKRKIITIDEKKCNGCALCIPNCPEGAIQIIDKKARLISDLFCDGLGACLGHCPLGAISIEEREAAAYNEKKVMANIVKQGINVIKAHLLHLKEHNEAGYLKEAMEFLKEKNINISPADGFGNRKPNHCLLAYGFGNRKPNHCLLAYGFGNRKPNHCPPADLFGHKQQSQSCPGSRMMDLRKKPAPASEDKINIASELSQWPIQLRLVPTHAPYFEGSDILITADCVPFAYANFHQDLLKGKIILVGCPKLDDVSAYGEKLKQIFAQNNIKSVSYAHMEVPCCFGLLGVIEEAIKGSGKKIPFEEITISIKGERL